MTLAHKRQQAFFYTGAAVLLWSTVATAFKVALRDLDVYQLLLYASLSSWSVLLFVFLIQRKKLNGVSPGQICIHLCMGLLNPVAYYIILFKAYEKLPAQEAQALNYTWPIWLVIFSIPVLGHRLKGIQVIGLVFGFIGTLLIGTAGQWTQWQGIPFGLGSAIIWALYWLFSTRSKLEPQVKLLLHFTGGLLPLFLITKTFASFQWPGLNAGLASIYVGFFEMGITFLLWQKALSLARNTAEISYFVYLVPFLSLLFIKTILSESISMNSLLGLLFIVTGILLPQMYIRNNFPRKN
jgi:drug/metabolite transporter (DMT)-like permease